MPGGGQDVRQKQHLLVRQRSRHFEWPDIALRHAYIFGLPTRNAAVQMAVAKQRRAWGNRLFIQNRPTPDIGCLAGSEGVHLTEEAAAAGDDERDHHAVARFDCADLRPDFFDDAHELMAKNIAVLGGRNLAAIQVQVRAADSRRGNLEQHVIGFLNEGVGNGFHSHLVGAVISQCTHERLLALQANRCRRRVLRGAFNKDRSGRGEVQEPGAQVTSGWHTRQFPVAALLAEVAPPSNRTR